MKAHRGAAALAATIVGFVALAGCSSDANESGPPTAPIATAPATGAATGQSTGPASVPTSAPTTVQISAGATTSEPSLTAATVSTTALPATTAVPVTATTLAPTSANPPAPTQIAFTELGEVASPTNLAVRPNDSTLFVVSRDGFIVAMRDGTIDDQRLLDISDSISAGGEQGLLGLAFSVDGAKAYVNYTNRSGDTEIVEYLVGSDGVFDPASKRLLLEIDQPYGNHNGGQVRIGPDGYLYIGMGDGGSGGDPERRALNVASLLGKLLRIDPNPLGDSPYSIPPDNPFIGVGGARTELWSVGLRNPWRFTFDLATRDLWIANVGQGDWEEINVGWADQGGGRAVNYGWSAFEGTHRFNDDQPAGGAVPPIFEYRHGARGCSVSGGVRYRGSAIPALYGWYVYADYCNGEVRALRINDDRTAGQEVILTDEIGGISEVAQDANGELYVLSVDNDRVFAVGAASD